jgi:arsenic resistance protein ArsH
MTKISYKGYRIPHGQKEEQDLTVDLPNLVTGAYENPNPTLLRSQLSTHRPRILLLYGSLRDRSYSRFLPIEAAQLLEALGAEKKTSGLPLPDDAPVDHPKVQELRNLSA